MTYGYVRHSLNNQKFIELQIDRLNIFKDKPDQFVVETNRNEQLQHLIENLNIGDRIVVTDINRLSTISEDGIAVLKEKEIEIETLDGYMSAYKQSDESGILMIVRQLNEMLNSEQEKIDKYAEEHPEEFSDYFEE